MVKNNEIVNKSNNLGQKSAKSKKMKNYQNLAKSYKTKIYLISAKSRKLKFFKSKTSRNSTVATNASTIRYLTTKV